MSFLKFYLINLNFIFYKLICLFTHICVLLSWNMPQITSYSTILYKNRKLKKSDYLPHRKPKNAAGKLRINTAVFFQLLP